MTDNESVPNYRVPGRVSTVITSYNKGPYLAEAIESALGQDYEPQEIIVVDDGSTDNTREVAEAFGKRIRYCFQTNRGPAAAKNRGIELGTGEYVAFLDGDDRWRPGKLAPQIALLDKDASVGVVYGPAATISSEDAESPRRRSRLGDFCRGRILDELIVRNFIPFSSAIVRRRCVAEAGMLDESERVADDYEFWLRMALHCAFDYVDEIVVDYRMGVDQIAGRFSSMRRVDEALRIQRQFADRFFDGKYPRSDVFRRGIATKYAGLGDCLLGAGQQRAAFRAHLTAVSWEPCRLQNWRSIIRDLIPNHLVGILKRRFTLRNTSTSTTEAS